MDMDKMHGTCKLEETRDGMAILTGSAPVSTMQDYQKEVVAYTKGHGKLSLSFKGYGPCHNEQEVVEAAGYDSERDLDNPTGSVFCSHGAGFPVSWDQVKHYMHLESVLGKKSGQARIAEEEAFKEREEWIGTDEIDRILNRTFYANRKEMPNPYKRSRPKRWEESNAPITRTYRAVEPDEEYLLVDGYNVIFANEELRELAEVNMDSASTKLMDLLCNYQGIRKCSVILVFDAYKIKGHQTEVMEYHNIHVVYTKEAETADQYIEKFAHQNRDKYKITVATSDGVEQIIIMGKGCHLFSSREFWKEMKQANQKNQEEYESRQINTKNYLFDSLSKEVAEKLKDIHKENPEE